MYGTALIVDDVGDHAVGDQLRMVEHALADAELFGEDVGVLVKDLLPFGQRLGAGRLVHQ
ncbi:unannotated protein [freshwater metagenome]|uniref:Unannotated protein n=1 Tax=freshwater metagenome TaxID=449393 RepID=A0A6J6Y878_9ZZZZ